MHINTPTINHTKNTYILVGNFSGGNSADSASLEVDDGAAMRTSKSDTSLTDSFVMIPDSRKKMNPLNALRPGINIYKLQFKYN